MNGVLVSDIIVAANIVKEFSHKLGTLNVGLGFLDMVDFLDTGKRFEELKIAPKQVELELIIFVALGVERHDVVAVADDIEPRIVSINFVVRRHQHNFII